MQKDDSTTLTLHELPRLCELQRELRHCGWRECQAPALGDEIFFQTFQGPRLAPCGLWAGEADRQLILIALENLTLPADEELCNRFINIPLETRMALAAARRLTDAEWLLLVTTDRVELYRLSSEACECRATNPDELDDEMWPMLATLARGRADAAGASTQHSLPGAEPLRNWLRHWSPQLGCALELTAGEAETMLWQWILSLQMTRRIEGSEAAGGWGLYCEAGPVSLANGHEVTRWRVGYDALSATEELGRALELFTQNFGSRLFSLSHEGLSERLAAIDETSLIERLRAELLMHSQDRFEPETVAWLYTDLAREQEGWRREIAGVEPLRRRFQHEAWLVYNPLICQIGQHGITAALRDIDRLAAYVAGLSTYDRARQLELAQGLAQPDLFMRTPRGVSVTGELVDALNYLFAEAIRLEGVEAGRRFGLGVVFLLKGLALAQRHGWPFLGIDAIDAIFEQH